MMNNQVTNAIKHLEEILPLQKNFSSLDDASKKIYQGILKNFIDICRAPSKQELGAQFDNSEECVQLLASKAMITLDNDFEIDGAYPFTMQERIHRVSIHDCIVHAMCALDALAPSAMFKCETKVYSECEVTRQPVYIEMNNKQILNGDARGIYFGINWQAASSTISCSDSLCTEMIFLQNKTIANEWLGQDTKHREIFTLQNAIEFSAGFFTPLVQET